MAEACFPELHALYVKFHGCMLRSSCIVFIVVFSHLSLFALTIDRYIFIKRPLHYPLIMTPTQTWIMVLAVFLAAFVNALVAGLGFQVTMKFSF